MENPLVVLLLLNITQLQNKYSDLYCLLSDYIFQKSTKYYNDEHGRAIVLQLTTSDHSH